MNNIKCQNLVIFPLKIRMKSINDKYNEKSKYQQYFHYFIICILVSYDFSLSADLEARRLLELRRLFEGGAYFNVDTQRRGVYLRPGDY